MAGFYPDVPGNRFAYDKDGTYLAIKHNGTGVITEISASAGVMNDEDTADYYEFGGYANTSIDFIIIFPEHRDLYGYFFGVNNFTMSLGALEYSSDTTDGQNGTWTAAQNPFVYYYGSAVLPMYRTAIQPLSLSNVKSLRFKLTPQQSGYPSYLNPRLYALHLYGQIHAGANNERLAFWDSSLNQECAGSFFDYGDVAQGNSQTKTFQLKNLSSASTANSVILAADDKSTGMVAEFSTDGTNYANPLDIGNIAPGATTADIYCRTTLSASQTVRVEASHLSATASSWS